MESSRYPYFSKLIEEAKKLPPLRIAVVNPVDRLSLEGIVLSAQEGLIEPVLIGIEKEIRAAADEQGVDLSAFEIQDVGSARQAGLLAVEMAKSKQVESLMKGSIHTDDFFRPIIDKNNGLQTTRRMNLMVAVEIVSHDKVFFVTDPAINLFPTLTDKKDIIQNAIDFYNTLGMGVPNVAIISGVDGVDDKMPSTIQAAALSKMAERGQIRGGVVDGPLAFDNALFSIAADVKKTQSPVAGKADILIVPDMESGNMLVKSIEMLTSAAMAGIVLGAQVPIIFTSRSSKVIGRMTSCAMTLFYARRRER